MAKILKINDGMYVVMTDSADEAKAFDNLINKEAVVTMKGKDEPKSAKTGVEMQKAKKSTPKAKKPKSNKKLSSPRRRKV